MSEKVETPSEKYVNDQNIKALLVNKVQVKLEDQDFMQRLYMLCIVPLELYRVMVSSLLIVFVPQDCTGHLCTLQENMTTTSINYKAGLAVNFFTLFIFLLMYFYEVRREHMMIEYLEVNPDSRNNDADVAENLKYLANEKKDHLLSLITIYRNIGAFAIVMYVVNAILSAFIISHYILGNQTVISFCSNVLIMVLKFADVYMTIKTEPNVFLSAYLKTKIQYNDVDPDHKRNSLSRRDIA